MDLRDVHEEAHGLSGSQLQGANLQDASLNNTNPDGADLQAANRAGVKQLKLLALGKGEELAAGRLHSCLKRCKPMLDCAFHHS